MFRLIHFHASLCAHSKSLARLIETCSQPLISPSHIASSVELALDCLEHERLQCRMGGVSFALEEVSSVSLRARVQVCLLHEADQTCTIQPVTTSASFVSACGMHIDPNSLCRYIVLLGIASLFPSRAFHKNSPVFE